MNRSKFADIGAELKAKKARGSKKPAQTTSQQNGQTAERLHVVTSAQPTVSTRKPGKRKSGFVQISGLVPPETRDDVNVALVFESQDLSELLTDLLNGWLASRPAHVRAAIEAQRKR